MIEIEEIRVNIYISIIIAFVCDNATNKTKY